MGNQHVANRLKNVTPEQGTDSHSLLRDISKMSDESKEEASKKAMVSGASGMNFGGNGCNFTINFTFGQ